MVYTLRLEDEARQWHAEMIAVGIAAAMGGDVSMPSWEEVKAQFDGALAADPAPAEPVWQPSEGRGGSGRAVRLRALRIPTA